MKILANINSRSFGDFAVGLSCINTIADQFDERVLMVLTKDDRDFKQPLLRCMKTDGLYLLEADAQLPSMEYLNADATCEGSLMYEQTFGNPWFKGEWHRPDLFISDQFSSWPGFCHLERKAYLRFPDTTAEALGYRLRQAGVDISRWFVTVHAREPGYSGKPEGKNFRDQDPAVFLPAVQHIIRSGGQVVRLGHPSMTPYPPMAGLTDLTGSDSELQVFAITRSRFLLGGPSGPSGIAFAFHIPHAMVNAVHAGPESDVTTYMTPVVETPQSILSGKELFTAGWDKLKLKAHAQVGNIKINWATAKDVIALTEDVLAKTTDCVAWRQPESPSQVPRPNSLTWPGCSEIKGHFFQGV